MGPELEPLCAVQEIVTSRYFLTKTSMISTGVEPVFLNVCFVAAFM
jgi:hypothetical protein